MRPTHGVRSFRAVLGPALALTSAVVMSLLLLSTVLSGQATAQDGGTLGISIRDSAFDADGFTRLVVNVTGSAKPEALSAEAFSVHESGEDVGPVEIDSLLDNGTDSVAVILALDTSSSMEGEPLEEIRSAAALAVESLIAEGVLVGLVEFETDTTLHSGPTQDVATLQSVIEGLEASGRTALYDGVMRAMAAFDDPDAQGNILVFADGEDNQSERTAEEVIAAASEQDIPITVIGFDTDLLDIDVLRPLAEETGGRLITTTETELIGEVFAEAATDVASQYVLTYRSAVVEPTTLDIDVSVDVDAVTASTSFSAPNRRDVSAVGQPPVTTRPAQPPGLFASQSALYGGVIAAFAALLLLFGLMFAGQRTTADRVLAGQLERYIERGDRRAGRSGLVATHFRERAMEFLESTPKPEGFDERLSLRLEQAAWPLRNGEFILMSVGLALIVGTLVGVLANPLGGVLLAVVAGATPWAILEIRRSRRQDAFLRNLPDTLQLMAGSLRAGYGVLQALDGVAKEATGPAADEFQRVITEARLGMPVEEALEAMAERIDSDDFRWVVLAINIQREVGGNLAELLDSVAETLREREMLRRQIKVLSAEGRLSAVILVALPFVLVLYLILVRPEYIATLVTSGLFGWTMVVGAGVLMVIGIIWIRKMIQIEV